MDLLTIMVTMLLMALNLTVAHPVAPYNASVTTTGTELATRQGKAYLRMCQYADWTGTCAEQISDLSECMVTTQSFWTFQSWVHVESAGPVAGINCYLFEQNDCWNSDGPGEWYGPFQYPGYSDYHNGPGWTDPQSWICCAPGAYPCNEYEG